MASLLKQYHNNLDRTLMTMKSNRVEDQLEHLDWGCERLTCFILRLLDVDESKIHRHELEGKLRLAAKLLHQKTRTQRHESACNCQSVWSEVSGMQQPYMDVVGDTGEECRLELNI